MRLILILLYSVLLLVACSSSHDVAVTQTGNPTQVSLVVRADTTQTPYLQKKAGRRLFIQRAYLVLYEVELAPVDGTESVLFRREEPYIIELLPGAGSGIVDTTHVTGSRSFETIEIEFGPANSPGLPASVPDSLKGKSVLVEGYFDADTLDTFLFTSDFSGEREYTLDSVMNLPGSSGSRILATFRIHDWFRDSLGAVLDPRDPVNRPKIEANIIGTVEVEEDTDDESETDREESEASGA